MIQTGTRLRVADNSGAKVIECFRILGRGRATTAFVGDVIVAAVKQATPNAGVKKGDVVKAVVAALAGRAVMAGYPLLPARA